MTVRVNEKVTALDVTDAGLDGLALGYVSSSVHDRGENAFFRWRRARGVFKNRLNTWELRLADEGVWWCRGWKGEAVDALRVVAALSR